MRQLAPLFGISKSAADRIIDHIGPLPALRQQSRFHRDTVLIVDGTLALTRDHSVSLRQLEDAGQGAGVTGSRGAHAGRGRQPEE